MGILTRKKRFEMKAFHVYLLPIHSHQSEFRLNGPERESEAWIYRVLFFISFYCCALERSNPLLSRAQSYLYFYPLASLTCVVVVVCFGEFVG
jgi:hypothetical protein